MKKLLLPISIMLCVLMSCVQSKSGESATRENATPPVTEEKEDIKAADTASVRAIPVTPNTTKIGTTVKAEEKAKTATPANAQKKNNQVVSPNHAPNQHKIDSIKKAKGALKEKGDKGTPNPENN